MPKRILLIGAVFCLLGGWAIVDVIAAALDQRVFLNPAALLLPIGIGLLKGQEGARFWARFCFILTYCYCALMIILPMSGPFETEALGVTISGFHARAEVFGVTVSGSSAIAYAIASSALIALGSFVFHRLLYSEKANAFFLQSEKEAFIAMRAKRSLR